MHRSRLLVFALAASVAQVAHAYPARLLSSHGTVEVQRGARSAVVHGRVELAPGDGISAGSDGAASVMVGDSMLYLDSEAAVSLNNAANEPAIKLHQGRARVVVVRNGKLQLVTPTLRAELTEGIYEVAVDSVRTQLHNVAGEAIVFSAPRRRSAGRRTVALAAFQQPAEQIVPPGESLTVPPSDEENADAADEPTAEDEEDEERRRRELQEEAADAAEQEDAAQQDDDQLPDEDEPPSSRGADAPTGAVSDSQNNISAGGVSTSFGGLSASFSLASGGLFADAAQSTNQGQIVANPPAGSSIGDPFPGNIHLLTAESRYALAGLKLNGAEKDEIFPTVDNDPVYFSIGTGALPTNQVFTDFLTASDPVPTAFTIPGFDAYVVKFTQFGLIDAGLDPTGAEQNVQGVTGLVGPEPVPAPSIFNATPTVDERAEFNELATFALGEFRLRPDAGQGQNQFELAVRRSDQDRLIVKDGGGNDANDAVTPHPDLDYDDVADPRFQPAAPTVKVPDPDSFDNSSTAFAQINDLRRAAATTIMANQLQDFAQRTGQTRFVVGGKIVDISGYKP